MTIAFPHPADAPPKPSWSAWNLRLRSSPWVAGSVLTLVAFVAFAGSLSGGFVYDDEVQILQNPFVLNPHLWTRTFTAAVWPFQGAGAGANFYRPLQFFCYSLLCRINGPDPFFFHLFNVVLYAATAWIVYRVGVELLRDELAAFAGACLWAVHPLHTEAVAWVSALPDVGCGFFYLLGLLLFLRAERSPRRRFSRHPLAALAYAPALFFKEFAVSFPLLVVAYGFFFPSRDRAAWRERVVGWIPYFAAVCGYLAVRRHVLGHLSRTVHLWQFTLQIVSAAVALVGQHARLFFWPAHLTAFRTFALGPGLRSPWPWLTLAAIIGVVAWREREPVLGFLLFAWLIPLLPCLDIRQLSFPLLADRFSYVPSAGLCLAVSFVILVKLPAYMPNSQVRQVALAGLAAICILGGTLSAGAVRNWRDEESLLNYSLKQAPDTPALHEQRGVVLEYRYRNFDGAEREYHLAMSLNRTVLRPMVSVNYDCLLGLGRIAQHRRHIQEALDRYRAAVRLLPRRSEAYDALGAVFFPNGNYTESAAYFGEAVRANPQDLGARFYLGTCWLKLARYRDAAEQFRAATLLDPTYRQAYEAEARALDAAGDPGGAEEARRLGAQN